MFICILVHQEVWSHTYTCRWYSGKESACQCRRHRRHGFKPWVGKVPWRRKWQPTPVFLPGKFQGQRSIGRLQSIRLQRIGHNLMTKHTTYTYTKIFYLYIYTHIHIYTYIDRYYIYTYMGFPDGSDSKESACDARDLDLVHGSGRSPGEGNGYPLQHSCLENPMDRGAWWDTVHEVAESQTWLINTFASNTQYGILYTCIHAHIHVCAYM